MLRDPAIPVGGAPCSGLRSVRWRCQPRGRLRPGCGSGVGHVEVPDDRRLGEGLHEPVAGTPLPLPGQILFVRRGSLAQDVMHDNCTRAVGRNAEHAGPAPIAKQVSSASSRVYVPFVATLGSRAGRPRSQAHPETGNNRLEGVGHSYGDLEVVRGIDLEIPECRIICILGPSGCGKSTLLRFIGGLECPDVGQVLQIGSPPEGCLNPLTYIFQDFALLPWRTVYGNVSLVLEDHDLRGATAREIIDDVLARTKLSDFANALPRQLSGGMKQRVAVARACGQSRGDADGRAAVVTRQSDPRAVDG